MTFDFRKSRNYLIMIITSIVMLLFPPFMGSIAGLGWAFPTTPAGWIVWAILNISSAIFNCLLFYAFIEQGKDNVKEDPKQLAAIDMLKVNNIVEEKILLSPQQIEAREWKTKAVWIAVGTLLGTIALTQAILQFDAIRLISQILALTVGLIFGILEQKKIEWTYTDHYLAYAEQQVRFKQEAEAKTNITEYIEETSITTIQKTRELPLEKEE